ncbi:MAG: ABC transporter ATP-binding protein [Peptococcaceae bacterium]|nr:ABC transporter ATP-binding protein [Peptococcaceae bacterium]
MNVLEVDRLTKYYGKVRGVENLSFALEKGEIFGFIGPNGAGKTTTIRAILGLVFPTRGGARIFGEDCISQGHNIRRRIGYLPSEVFYYDQMKVMDLLLYSASFYGKDCRRRIHELSEAMELDLGRRIEELSYGNKKKVGIVQGLLHEPDLLLLDEPTSGLDPLMQRRFFELVLEENKRGATVFFSSHILSEVQHMCMRVGIMKDGNLIKIENIETMRQDNYKRVSLRTKGVATANLRLDGVTNLLQENHTVKFFYKGNIDSLLAALAALDLVDAVIEDPSLEEIFMHYYGPVTP